MAKYKITKIEGKQYAYIGNLTSVLAPRSLVGVKKF